MSTLIQFSNLHFDKGFELDNNVYSVCRFDPSNSNFPTRIKNLFSDYPPPLSNKRNQEYIFFMLNEL